MTDKAVMSCVYRPFFIILFAFQILLLGGCVPSTVDTSKVNPSSIEGYDADNPIPVFNYASLTNSYQLGVPFILSPSVAFAGSGLTFSYSGTLPTGLSFNPVTGAITGIPTSAPGSSSYTITATNNAGPSSKTIILVTAPIFNYPLQSYNYVVSAAFTPVSPTITYPTLGSMLFTVDPALPAGLSINPFTGEISGTPTSTNVTTAYIITATVNGLSSSVLLELLPAGPPNIAYSATYYYVRNAAFSEGPNEIYAGPNLVYSSPSGSLPTGLALDPGTGVISGTASVGGSGDHSYVVRATNDYGFVDHNVDFIEVGPPIFSPNSYTEDFERTVAFSLDLEAALTFPAASDVTYTSSPTLPNANCSLSLDASTGVISGTIAWNATTTANDCARAYTITATNNADPLERTSTISVTLTEVGPPQVGYPITTQTYENGVAFTTITPAYYYLGTLDTPGYTLTSGSLPTGLTLNSSTGVISGTPTDTVDADGAVHQIEITVTNLVGSNAFTVDLEEIGAPRLSYATTDLTYHRRANAGESLVAPTISFCKGGCTFTTTAFAAPPLDEFDLDPATGEITTNASITTKISGTFDIDYEDSLGTGSTITGFTIEEGCNDTGVAYAGQDFGGGGGTIPDPFLLCTVQHITDISGSLATLANHYKLSTDINYGIADLPAEPIGISGGGAVGCFGGSLDGNGFMITNFKVHDGMNGAVSYRSGLFHCLEDFEVIQNLTLLNTTIISSNDIGSLAGYLTVTGAEVNSNIISEVYAYRSFLYNDNAAPDPLTAAAGGLIGRINCQSSATSVRVYNSVFHGTIRQSNPANIAGLFTANTSFLSCIHANDNVVFLRDTTNSGSNFTDPASYKDFNDYMGFGHFDPLITATIVVDMDAVSPDPNPSPIMGHSVSYVADDPTLNLDGTWLAAFGAGSIGYTDPSSEMGKVVPQEWCDRDGDDLVFAAINTDPFLVSGGGLVCL